MSEREIPTPDVVYHSLRAEMRDKMIDCLNDGTREIRGLSRGRVEACASLVGEFKAQGWRVDTYVSIGLVTLEAAGG